MLSSFNGAYLTEVTPVLKKIQSAKRIKKAKHNNVRRLSSVLCLDKERRRLNFVFFQSTSNSLSSFGLRVLDTFISLNGLFTKRKLCIPYYMNLLRLISTTDWLINFVNIVQPIIVEIFLISLH